MKNIVGGTAAEKLLLEPLLELVPRDVAGAVPE